MELTRIQSFGGWWAKREDEACATTPDMPSGSKVRQYAAMAKAQPGQPMLVGCSADSAMQVYVAAAAKAAGVPAIVYTAKRRQRSAATQYAIAMGAEVNEVGPGGYLSVLRARARDRARQLGGCVRWDPAAAFADASAQAANLPIGTRRVVVPTGSGLTCAGVLHGLAAAGWRGKVLAVCVSAMASRGAIMELVEKRRAKANLRRITLECVACALDYGEPLAAVLPDGTPLDPYYAAKALHFVKQGDVLWVPGLRPLCAMPVHVQEELARMGKEVHHDAANKEEAP